MLSLLLDENVSRRVARQIRSKHPEIPIISVYDWRGGALAQTDDRLLLAAAHEDGHTLVTYDLKTISPILVEFAGSGIDHSGVILIDNKTITSSDIGGIVRALIYHWQTYHSDDWLNRVDFLRPG